MKRIMVLIWSAFLSLIITGSVQAQALSWQEWVTQLRTEAIAQGIAADLFDHLFSEISEPSQKVVSFDRTQPEKRITYLDYRNSRADAYRISLGAKQYEKYSAVLTQIGQEYGIDPSYIVAVWGMETSYGRFMGNFPVIKALATLAYDDRRGASFRKELLIALHILNDGHVSEQYFKGEWAGASGQCQFLPSSWQRYAVDYNHDGHKDIWTTYSDAFASIANYLVQHGWEAGQPWGIAVDVKNSLPAGITSLSVQKPLTEWRELGVVPADGSSWPSENWDASLIEPYGGPAYLVFNNFRVIMRYNHSIYYAGTISYLAEQIRKKVE